jgi:hypothetical protein
MKLDYNKVEADANSLYGAAALKRAGLEPRYVAPETVPTIESQQVKCFFRALIDEINRQHEQQ